MYQEHYKLKWHFQVISNDFGKAGNFNVLTSVFMPGPGHSAVGCHARVQTKIPLAVAGILAGRQQESVTHTWRRAAFHASPGRKRWHVKFHPFQMQLFESENWTQFPRDSSSIALWRCIKYTLWRVCAADRGNRYVHRGPQRVLQFGPEKERCIHRDVSARTPAPHVNKNMSCCAIQMQNGGRGWRNSCILSLSRLF